MPHKFGDLSQFCRTECYHILYSFDETSTSLSCSRRGAEVIQKYGPSIRLSVSKTASGKSVAVSTALALDGGIERILQLGGGGRGGSGGGV